MKDLPPLSEEMKEEIKNLGELLMPPKALVFILSAITGDNGFLEEKYIENMKILTLFLKDYHDQHGEMIKFEELAAHSVFQKFDKDKTGLINFIAKGFKLSEEELADAFISTNSMEERNEEVFSLAADKAENEPDFPKEGGILGYMMYKAFAANFDINYEKVKTLVEGSEAIKTLLRKAA